MAHKKAGYTCTPPAFLTILFSIFTIPVRSPIPEHPLHPLLTGISCPPASHLFLPSPPKARRCRPDRSLPMFRRGSFLRNRSYDLFLGDLLMCAKGLHHLAANTGNRIESSHGILHNHSDMISTQQPQFFRWQLE